MFALPQVLTLLLITSPVLASEFELEPSYDEVKPYLPQGGPRVNLDLGKTVTTRFGDREIRPNKSTDNFNQNKATDKAALEGGGDENLKFCHSEKWSEACLYGLMVFRCTEYSIPLLPLTCAGASADFIDLLELARVDVVAENGKTYNLPVIFTQKILKLIRSPAVHTQLKILRFLLDESARTKSPFNLWAWALSTSAGNREKALEWLSVLLQDTSGIQIQVAYLDSVAKKLKFNEATKKAIDDLSELNTFLSNENLVAIKYWEWLTLYPSMKNIESDVTPLIYHFYPMAYYSLRLKKMGYSASMSSFLPFLFNTEYLMQTLDPEMWPLKHPRPEKIDLTNPRVQWKMRDIYNGYAGAIFGIQKTLNLPGLKPFQSRYAKAPFATMKHHYWAMPNP